MPKDDSFGSVSVTEIEIGGGETIEYVSNDLIDDGTLNAEVEDYDDDITSLEEAVDTLDRDVSSLESDVDTLQRDVSDAESDIDTVEGDIDDLEARGEVFVVDNEDDAPIDTDGDDLIAVRE